MRVSVELWRGPPDNPAAGHGNTVVLIVPPWQVRAWLPRWCDGGRAGDPHAFVNVAHGERLIAELLPAWRLQRGWRIDVGTLDATVKPVITQALGKLPWH